MDKAALVAAIRAEIAAEIAEMTRLAKDAADAATHEENKPENDKDMRSTEASYLARGQAERVQQLEREHTLLGAVDLRAFAADEPIQTGAYVELRAGTQVTRCLLAPAGGGRKRDGVQLVTTTSPLGAALLELSVGDEAEVPTPQGVRVFEVVKVG